MNNTDYIVRTFNGDRFKDFNAIFESYAPNAFLEYVNAIEEEPIEELDSSFNEAFIGKTPELLQCEKEIELLREEFQKTKKEDFHSKHLTTICKLLEKQFGFKKMYLIVEKAEYENAFAIPQFNVFSSIRNYITVDKTKGWYDSSHTLIGIVSITSKCLYDSEATPEEVIGVIIHEIGHNIEVTKWNYLNGCHSMSTLAGAALDDMTREYLAKLIEDAFTKGDQKAMAQIKKISKSNNKEAFELSLKDYFSGVGTKMEQVADATAALYGYGTAQAMFLAKSYDFIRKNQKKKSFAYTLYDLSSQLFGGFGYDEHRDTVFRAMSMIVKLKADVKTTDYVPEVKDLLLQNITDLEEALNRILKSKGFIFRTLAKIRLFFQSKKAIGI
jgi:hypothetical protein